MKSRKWIIIAAIILFIPVIAGFVLKYFGAPQFVNNILLSRLRPVLGEYTSIQSVKITLNSITLNKLTFQEPESNLSLRVNDARFNIKPLNVFLYGFSPINLVDEISVDGWDIEFKKRTSDTKRPEKSVESENGAFWEVLRKMVSMQRIDLNNGTLNILPVKVENINGWLNFSAGDSISFDFSSEILSDSANIRIVGVIDRLNERLNFDINLSNTQFPPGYKLGSDYSLDNGILDAKLKGGILENKLFLEGAARIKDIDLKIKDNLQFKEGWISAKIHTDSIDFSGGGKIIEQKISFSGKAFNVSKPVVDIKIDAADVALREVVNKFDPKLDIAGKMDLELNVKGSVKSPKIHFLASSQEISYTGMLFENSELEGDIESQKLKLRYFAFDGFGGSVEGDGIISLKKTKVSNFAPSSKSASGFPADKEIVMSLTADYSGKPAEIGFIPGIERIPVDSMNLKLSINGKIDDFNANGTYGIYPSIKLEYLCGEYKYADKKLELVESGIRGDSLGLVVDWNSKIPLFSLIGKNIHKIAGRYLPAIFNEEDVHTNIKAGGTLNKFSLLLSAGGSRVDISMNSQIERSKIIKFLGDYKLTVDDTLSTVGDIAFRIVDDTLNLDNFTFGPEFYAWGNLNIKNKEIGNFQAKADNLPLKEVLIYFGNDYWKKYSGEIKMDLTAQGKIDAPQAELSLYLSKGTLYGKQGYWATLVSELRRGVSNTIKLDFGNSSQTLFSGRGSVDFQTGDIDFRSQQEGVNFDLLVSALIGKQSALTGWGQYNIKAYGKLTDPKVETGFQIEYGTLFNIPFDQLVGDFGLRKDADSVLIIEVPVLRLFKRDGYDIGLEGFVPLEQKQVDLSLEMNGNLLSILPSVVKKTIISGGGSGTAELSIGGTLDSLIFKSGKINYKDGTLVLNRVTDKLSSLYLDVELENNFIHIRRLNGKIDKSSFRLYNVEKVETTGRKLLPWIIQNSGLSLGILVLEVGSEGIKLNIPSFINSNSKAMLFVEGLRPGEKAYIAGPEKHPVVRAKLLFKDGEIIYPPQKKKEPGKSPNIIQKLLKKIDWNLEVVPERGNVYKREISGLPGSTLLKNFSRVDVNINIDKQVDGLRVTGIIEDTTLALEGKFVSTRGTVSLLDLDFRMQEFTIGFDPTQKYPWVEGYASTTKKDSLGRSTTITLRVAHVDPATGEKNFRPRWGEFTFILEDEMGNSQEQILGSLGYAPETLGGKVTDASMQAVNTAVFGSWLGSLEREIKTIFGVDYVDINPAVAQNLLAENLFSQQVPGDTASIDWRAKYLTNSRFTVGKYITDDLFFTYAGKLETGDSPYDRRTKLGITHVWNLEYRLPMTGANLLIVYGYEYDNLERKDDQTLSVSYRFNF